ncbi:mevalonate kinase [Carnobacteriaceae bacterium zg-ZUI78]|uniref:mevalonate kinase n=1 Tax=Granulicatella sp. zg-84 TaxID=2678503 RepID=UPI0013C0E268|nr:mevalonate kinase [Granulicatella sp. zg-84]MBS4751139.1 mevalonate kinase [Carnobacteriaceae bacterium zg-ZUI78]NEW65535.1 mevalonate kinase [Granulicatella sp. zg-84]QMI85582.1 mevalonate kinase [Carnobacteriaceae bacterium zg-84]
MNITKKKTATGTASGKIILIGEHAAVYGHPAIAIPCTAVQTHVNISPAKNGLYLYCDLYEGLIDDMPELLTGLKTIINATLYYLNQEHTPLHIRIESSIPSERGMGSSAAVSCAIVRSLCQYFNKSITTKELIHLVQIAEKVVHGNPSGLDATIISTETPLFFEKGKPFKKISINTTGYLVIADTGLTGQTKQAIEKVATLKKVAPKTHTSIMTTLSNMTHRVTHYLATNQLHALGQTMTHAHHALQKLGVSHPLLDQLVSLSLEHGALGAKLTGGGLGGCMIALAKTKQDADALRCILLSKGAKQAFVQPL